MGAVELLLTRHGESEANVAAGDAERAGAERIDRPARDPDVVLTATGREQAEAIGHHLRELGPDRAPQAVWVSSYARARETAAIALETAGLDLPVRVDERLRDRELGILDGLTSHGVDVLLPEEAERRAFLGKFYYRPPGGESWADVALRVRSVLSEITVDAAGLRVLVVSHDAVTSVIRYVAERIEERDLLDEVRRNPMPNAALTRLLPRDGAWWAESVNEVEHLTRHDADVTEHSGEPDDTHP
ncbi:histidine phosphatase family protein [Herbiconiux sp. L3-i23]|uniref:histidine phosphatase family protein n=1 Tax=Herbiconiux sp. L3-i23 TaxID=2905871 RepID=UPI0020741FBA|nr:histidine phosphatase family protein [Herbiconiux sp. L3-i23]